MRIKRKWIVGAGAIVISLLFAVASTAMAADVRLIEAVQEQDQKLVRSLLNQHLDVNARSAMARRPFFGRRTGMISKPAGC